MITTKNNEHKKLNVPNKRKQDQTCLDAAEREGLRPKSNVPNLRFSEFQGEWEECRLGDVCTFLSGGTPKIDVKEYWNGTIPFVSAISMHDTYILDSKLHISEEGLKHGSRLLTKNNLLLLVRGSMLWNTIPICLNKNDVAFNQDVKGIIANDTINNEFLLYWLKSKEQRLKYMVTGTGLGAGKLDTSDLLSMIVYIPAMKEQDKVARLLSLFDERIATQSKIIEDLKKLKSAIIEKVFNGKHSEKLQLNDVGSYIRGLTYSSNDVVEHGGTIVMRSNNIINGSLLDYNNNVVFVNKQMSAEQQLQNGDVVICMANGSSSLVGKSSFYDGSCHSPITVGAFCGIYRSKEPIVKWLFQTNKYRRYIWNSLQGGNGAIANLNGEDILNMSFSIPNATIKDTCVKMLTSVNSALENNMSLCALYTLQKQHLLRQMFI